MISKEDAETIARLLRTVAQEAPTPQLRAEMGARATEYERASHDLADCLVMDEEAAITFASTVTVGMWVFWQDNWRTGFFEVRRVTSNAITAWDDNPGSERSFYINYSGPSSPLVVRTT